MQKCPAEDRLFGGFGQNTNAANLNTVRSYKICKTLSYIFSKTVGHGAKIAVTPITMVSCVSHLGVGQSWYDRRARVPSFGFQVPSFLARECCEFTMWESVDNGRVKTRQK